MAMGRVLIPSATKHELLALLVGEKGSLYGSSVRNVSLNNLCIRCTQVLKGHVSAVTSLGIPANGNLFLS